MYTQPLTQHLQKDHPTAFIEKTTHISSEAISLIKISCTCDFRRNKKRRLELKKTSYTVSIFF